MRANWVALAMLAVLAALLACGAHGKRLAPAFADHDNIERMITANTVLSLDVSPDEAEELCRNGRLAPESCDMVPEMRAAERHLGRDAAEARQAALKSGLESAPLVSRKRIRITQKLRKKVGRVVAAVGRVQKSVLRRSAALGKALRPTSARENAQLALQLQRSDYPDRVAARLSKAIPPTQANAAALDALLQRLGELDGKPRGPVRRLYRRGPLYDAIVFIPRSLAEIARIFFGIVAQGIAMVSTAVIAVVSLLGELAEKLILLPVLILNALLYPFVGRQWR